MKGLKSRAKTADGLLGEIERIILEEPKRYNQHETLLLEKRDGDGTSDGLYEEEKVEYPSCGTIGCVAGWVVALKRRRPERVPDVIAVADEILGLRDYQSSELFSSYAAGVGKPQTGAHARGGAKHIRKFRRKYRDQLRAKKV
jgi:hypothetical protein